jgi:cell division protein FtsZ
MGYAVMGTSTAKGENRAVEAAQRAIASPLLEAGAIDGARGILINITGSSSLKLHEVNEASTIIQNAAHDDANIIFGAVLDEKMKEEVKITVIATALKAFDRNHAERHSAAIAAVQQARGSASYQPVRPEPTIRHTPRVQQIPQPEPEMEESEPQPISTRAQRQPEPEPEPVAVHREASRPIPTVATEMKVELSQDDLDVPAFMRKRTN